MSESTVFDIFQTASAAAAEALGKTEAEIDKIKADAFLAAKHDAAEYSQWTGFFKSQLRNLSEMKKTPTQAAILAKQPKPVTT